MRVLLVEPWLDGSHRRWAEGYRAASSHDVRIVGLPGRLWRWRLRGGALPLSRLVEATIADEGRPDVLLVSGLVDVAQLLGFNRSGLTTTPVVIYQHESQLVYPTASATDTEAALRNWMSWCAADQVWFNSQYHLDRVVERLGPYVRSLPDDGHVPFVDPVLARFEVQPVGVDLEPSLATFSAPSRPAGPPVVLWPHRWEADKDPAAFGAALARADAAGLDFRLVLAGEDPDAGSSPASAARRSLQERFADRVLATGPFDRDRYAHLLRQSDLVVSCAAHEFFGVAVVEAVAAGCVPILPNALSYPELIPERWHEHVLYRPGTFGSALADAIRHVDHRRAATAGLAETMTRFDWSIVAPRYDARLLALVG